MYILSSTLIILCSLTLKDCFGVDSTVMLLVAFLAYFLLYKLNNKYLKNNIDNKKKFLLNVILITVNLFGYALYTNFNLVRTLSYFIVILIISTIIYFLAVYKYECVDHEDECKMKL